MGSIGVIEDWREGPRSPMAADHHEAMRPGEQEFATPPWVWLWDSSASFFLRAETETHAKMTVEWGVEGGEVFLDLGWERQGSKGFVSCENWPREVVGLKRVESPLPPAGWVVPGGGRGQGDGGSGGFRAAHLEAESSRSTFTPQPPPPESQEEGEYSSPKPKSKVQNPKSLIWGSWNDGIYRDIDQDRILQTADWIKANVPNCRWIQIDDGWAPIPNSQAPMSHFGHFYEPEMLEGDARFPDGMKGLAAAIKARGLRPMIWITPAVHENSSLYIERPDWFQPEARLYFMPELRFLDTSQQETRDFIDRSLDLVFGAWEFEGCKLDFWTMGFEGKHLGFQNPETDGSTERRWFVDAIRKRLPEDGILLHCIDIPFGDPHRSVGFDAFRYYSDSEGSCQNLAMMKEQALWAAFLCGFYRVQRRWIPDGDGMGLFRHFDMPENRYRLWLAFLMGSGTLLELSGWLHAFSNDPRLDLLRRVLPHANPGGSVEVPGFDFAQTDREPPVEWHTLTSSGLKLVALTNWSGSVLTRTITDELGPSEWEDLLTGEVFARGDEIRIGPEDGRLLVAR